MSLPSLHRQVQTALMAALIAVGAYMHFPLGPIPFTLQPLFVMFAGFCLGPRDGALAVAVYLAAGMIGAPVFAGGGAGFAYLFGPTGGFLFGFAACAALCGLGAPRRDGGLPPLWARIAWGAAGLFAVYGLGLVWLRQATGGSFGPLLALCLPLLGADAVKLGAALAAQRHLQRWKLLPPPRP